MRTIVAYVEGRAVWSESIPARARIPGVRGTTIVGGHGPAENARRAKNAATARKAAAERERKALSDERLAQMAEASKRYRDRKAVA